MAEPHVVSALTKKRAYLLGKLKEYQNLVKECKKDINAIDHSLHLFDSGYSIETIKPKRRYQHRFFKHGESTRVILELLKEHDQLTNRKIYQLAADKKGLTLSKELKREFSKSVNGILKLLERQGILENVDNSNNQIIWKIKELDLNLNS